MFFGVVDSLNLEVDVLFLDTTSTYVSRDTDGAPSQDWPNGGLRRDGHPEDSRPAGRVKSYWPHHDGLIWPHLGCWRG